MMPVVESEREEMGKKHATNARLLQQALQDILFLRERNHELERNLVAAQTWESRY
jgi:hypothetical protein